MSNPHFGDDYWHREALLTLAAAPGAENLREVLSALKALPGIKDASIDDNALQLAYDLRVTNLLTIKRCIVDAGISIEESLWQKFCSVIRTYRESILRAEQGIDYGWDVWIQDAYVSRYRLRRHGRRDDRITNWRMYERDKQD